MKHVAAWEKKTQGPKDRPNTIGKSVSAQCGDKTDASFLSCTFASRQRCQNGLILFESALKSDGLAASGDLL
jgi:hypothetical protein